MKYMYWCVTIQMKAIDQYFHVVLFITLYKVVLSFNSVGETLVCDHSNESYWGQYFHVVPFIMRYNEVWTFTSVNEMQVCDHFNESYMY